MHFRRGELMDLRCEAQTLPGRRGTSAGSLQQLEWSRERGTLLMGLPFLPLPQDHLSTSHETPQPLSLFIFTCFHFSSSPHLSHSIPPCRGLHEPVSDFLQPPCRRCPSLHMLFVIWDTCGFLFSCFHTNANIILLL